MFAWQKRNQLSFRFWCICFSEWQILEFWIVVGSLIVLFGILVGVFDILDVMKGYLEAENFAFGIRAGVDSIRDDIMGLCTLYSFLG